MEIKNIFGKDGLDLNLNSMTTSIAEKKNIFTTNWRINDVLQYLKCYVFIIFSSSNIDAYNDEYNIHVREWTIQNKSKAMPV